MGYEKMVACIQVRVRGRAFGGPFSSVSLHVQRRGKLWTENEGKFLEEKLLEGPGRFLRSARDVNKFVQILSSWTRAIGSRARKLVSPCVVTGCAVVNFGVCVALSGVLSQIATLRRVILTGARGASSTSGAPLHSCRRNANSKQSGRVLCHGELRTAKLPRHEGGVSQPVRRASPRCRCCL
jgi:hypothetical protein